MLSFVEMFLMPFVGVVGVALVPFVGVIGVALVPVVLAPVLD